MAAAAACSSALVRSRSAGLSSILRSAFCALAAHADPPASAGLDTISAVKRAILSESDPDRIADLFQSAAHLPRFYAHRPIFSLTVDKLARAKRPDLVDRLLSPLLSDVKCTQNEGFIIRLISLYSSAGMLDHAEATFNRIPQLLGRSGSDKSLSALLFGYFRNRQFDLVIKTFNHAPKQLGAVPGINSYNVLLQTLCQKNDLETARNVIDGMAEKGIAPDIISFNTLLSGYLKNGGDDRFDEILEQISSAGLEPNVVTCNCRISKFCQNSETFKAQELLDVMVSKGIHPNLTTFSTIISGYSAEGNVNAALEVFKRMKVMKRTNKSEGVSPNAYIYCVLVRDLVQNGEFGEALGICQECLNNKYVLPFEVVKALIDGLVKDSRIDEAKDVAAKMRMIVKGSAINSWNELEGELSL
ncbi:pentatricopeptide repeat-containing protein At1g61870, mitochondrial-like [Zingiber officinale]|uniref:pentatricopeptide repeat-containing protein At1g61870, mitochondrial-like n=1 Tax=Zingiber officinale TaxID=94328 RepID=UPI001C4C3B7F|nr:pentatricopeptide repeat-containing protein At1g61870, mitochondrial-like [Zingiber officinale]